MAVLTIGTLIIVYVAVLFFLYKVVEKLFKVLFFVVSALFVLALIYTMYKGI